MVIGNLEQMLNDFDNGTYDFTNNGECAGCGNCCGNMLPMTAEEIAIIRDYIKKHNIKEQLHNYPFAKPLIEMTCPFLDDSKNSEKCRIYEVRPRVCRDFICKSEKRPVPDLNYVKKCELVDVRNAFYPKMEQR